MIHKGLTIKGEKNIYLFILILALLVYIAILLQGFVAKEEFIVIEHTPETYTTLTNEIAAEAAIVYNITKDTTVMGKDITDPKPIASITKLISALLIYPQLTQTDETIIDATDFALSPNTSLRKGEAWNTLQLLEFSLITSSNRGIHAVGRTVEKNKEIAIIEQMNAFAKEHNLAQTHFINKTGLDSHGTLAGSESSAKNLAKMASIFVTQFPELALLTTKPSEVFYSLDGRKYIAKNTNILLTTQEIPVVLSKTGYTDLAGGALIMVLEYTPTEHIAFVVLGSTKTKRFKDMQTLISLYTEKRNNELSEQNETE